MITAPFTDYLGHTWTPSLIATYNRFDEQVSKRERQNPPPGSEAHKELEFYRNQRHKQFIQCSEIAAGLPRQSTVPKARPDFEALP